MDYAEQQRNPGKHLIGVSVVVVLHLLLAWALVTGLARTVIEVIKAPIETKIIEEIKPPPPPPPENLPPPPEDRAAAAVLRAAARGAGDIHRPRRRRRSPPRQVAAAARAGDASRRRRPWSRRPRPPRQRHRLLLRRAARTAPKLDFNACAKPEYNAAARRADAQGTVVVVYTMDTTGTISDARVEKSSGSSREHKMLDRMTLAGRAGLQGHAGHARRQTRKALRTHRVRLAPDRLIPRSRGAARQVERGHLFLGETMFLDHLLARPSPRPPCGRRAAGRPDAGLEPAPARLRAGRVRAGGRRCAGGQALPPAVAKETRRQPLWPVGAVVAGRLRGARHADHLVIMCMGSWYIIFTKLFEQRKLMQSAEGGGRDLLEGRLGEGRHRQPRRRQRLSLHRRKRRQGQRAPRRHAGREDRPAHLGLDERAARHGQHAKPPAGRPGRPGHRRLDRALRRPVRHGLGHLPRAHRHRHLAARPASTRSPARWARR